MSQVCVIIEDFSFLKTGNCLLFWLYNIWIFTSETPLFSPMVTLNQIKIGKNVIYFAPTQLKINYKDPFGFTLVNTELNILEASMVSRSILSCHILCTDWYFTVHCLARKKTNTKNHKAIWTPPPAKKILELDAAHLNIQVLFIQILKGKKSAFYFC